jgi:uncharacterized RDD family membrane protein YckC
VAEVVTGEAVVLEVPCARFPSRMLAFGIDLSIQVTMIFVLLAIVGVTAADRGLDADAVGAVALTVIVLTIVGYPIIWETTTRGRSPGKLALGLRVVSDDGGPERFRQALVRGLATIVDFWLLPFFGVPALICSLLSDKGKRLGDVFAGTFVIQQRLPARPRAAAAPPAVPPQLAAWATTLELSGLTDQTAATARRYLGRLPELTPSARAELGERIAAAVMTQVSPPPPGGTPVPFYLSAVLAERHRREHARLMAPAAAAAGWVPLPAPVPLPGPVPPWAPPASLGAAAVASGAVITSPWAAPGPAWGPGTHSAPGSASELPTAPVAESSQVPAAESRPGPAAEPPHVPATEWLEAAWEGDGSQSERPGGPTSPPATGTGFVPPQ